MLVAPWLTLLGGYAALLLLALCIVCGLAYAAELAEEHSVLTGKILARGLGAVVVLHVVLLLDGFAEPRVVFIGALCHCTYALLLFDFPRLEAASPACVASAVAVLGNHWSWQSHFANTADDALPLLDLLGFFLVFVWATPFAFFISLSINEGTLPYGAQAAKPRSTNAFLRLVAAFGARMHAGPCARPPHPAKGF
ncbi:transmembrane adaptor Erv26 [Pelagophyceae sp. CCMP2097]|nr:transmembrane adaptor Erv26 [Pelagophyceae sp. CCMP2097]